MAFLAIGVERVRQNAGIWQGLSWLSNRVTGRWSLPTKLDLAAERICDVATAGICADVGGATAERSSNSFLSLLTGAKTSAKSTPLVGLKGITRYKPPVEDLLP